MQFLTWAQAKLKIQEKTDSQDEAFISASELLRYCHDAIDYCEAEIHKFEVADKYFESVYPVQITAGIQNYQLPPNIYANKVLKLIKNLPNDVYEVKRLKRLNRYTDASYLEHFGDTLTLAYMIINDSANTKPVLRMFPRPSVSVTPTVSVSASGTAGDNFITVTDATSLVVGQFVQQPSVAYGTNIPEGARIEAISGLTITLSTEVFTTFSAVSTSFVSPDYLLYYLRNANKPAVDADLIDIPEFSTLIVQFCIVEVLKKDIGNPRLQEEKDRLQELKDQMASTLSGMVPDQDDKIEIDMSLNMEMS